jgi:hypothetical protein
VETCTVETGLLRKTACGNTAVAKCANCEQPLCSKHAVAQLSATGKKTGTFLCGECHAAQRHIAKVEAKATAAPAAPKPAAPKPAAPAAAAPARPPAGGAPKAPATTPAAAAKPLEENSDGSIDFTPTKKPE